MCNGKTVPGADETRLRDLTPSNYRSAVRSIYISTRSFGKPLLIYRLDWKGLPFLHGWRPPRLVQLDTGFQVEPRKGW
jgi:hypothetical protein